MAHAHCMLGTLGYKHTIRICNTAFPLQHWLHEHPTVLLYTYIAFFFNKVISPTKEAIFSVTLLNLRTPSSPGRLDCVLFIVQAWYNFVFSSRFIPRDAKFSNDNSTCTSFLFRSTEFTAARSKASFCGHSLPGITSSHPSGVMDVCHECYVLSGRGLCDGLHTRPEKSYQVCVCLIFRDLETS